GPKGKGDVGRAALRAEERSLPPPPQETALAKTTPPPLQAPRPGPPPPLAMDTRPALPRQSNRRETRCSSPLGATRRTWRCRHRAERARTQSARRLSGRGQAIARQWHFPIPRLISKWRAEMC